MNKLIAVIIFGSLLALSSGEVVAEQSSSNEKIDVKCHLNLVDGSEGIYYWHISTERFSNINKWLPNSTVSPQKTNEKFKVYKVQECVLTTTDFTNKRSNFLDEKTPK